MERRKRALGVPRWNAPLLTHHAPLDDGSVAARWPTRCARSAMDAVQQANSGHPGAPMGMAEMAVALWGRHLRHNPADPHWPDRDRFVLSNGHASMLLYALLHLTGYDLPIDELQRFRQLHSKTPGHPEVGVTPGVETTTGPLGQGLANAVGMALAEKLLAAEFNRDGHAIVDHHTYVFLGDGCLMEGISHEACALAGAWKLGKLIALYDDNGISIDGAVDALVHRRHAAQRFRAYGWHVIGPIDGHDVDAVDARRCGAGTRQRRQADADRLPDHHRQGRARPRRHRQGARRAAGRRRDRGRRAGAAAGRTRRSRCPTTCARHGTRGPPARARAGALERALRRLPRGASRAGGRVRAPHRGGELPPNCRRAPTRRCWRCAAPRRESRWPRARPPSSRSKRWRRAARAARRLGRPDRLEPHRLQARRRCASRARQRRRPPHQLRRARVRHGRDHERHRAARRLHPVRRHLPDLQRLQPQRDPHGRADEAARDPRVHARLHRPRRRRADAPAGRARWPRCA